eukprot:358316-Chlamydomonas_euryale.AAC.7
MLLLAGLLVSCWLATDWLLGAEQQLLRLKGFGLQCDIAGAGEASKGGGEGKGVQVCVRQQSGADEQRVGTWLLLAGHAEPLAAGALGYFRPGGQVGWPRSGKAWGGVLKTQLGGTHTLLQGMSTVTRSPSHSAHKEVPFSRCSCQLLRMEANGGQRPRQSAERHACCCTAHVNDARAT